VNAEEQKTIQDRLRYLSVRKRLSLQGSDDWRIASPPWISVAQLKRPPSAVAGMAAVSSRLGPYKRCQLATGQPPRQAELAAMTDAVCQMASLKKSEKREDESAAQL
jgi:hypothetical protein